LGKVKELLQAFGPLKAFHLVREAGSTNSKGYGFCEYADPAITDKACEGLNNLAVGDKTLTVRRAMSQQEQAAQNALGGAVAGGMISMNDVNAALGMAGVAGLAGAPQQPLSRILVLSNMVTPEELEDDEEFADITDDIREEASKHGAVLSVAIPRPKDGRNAASVGKVFVEFEKEEGSHKAATALGGRKFGDNIVGADFFDETKYANKDFS